MVWRIGSAFFLCVFLCIQVYAQGNTINKHNFNFGHQLGYLYSRTDDAYFHARGTWSFETGFVAFYTSEMPLVRNPELKARTLLQVPFGLEISPSDNIVLQINSDFIAELPYKDGRPAYHSLGGNSPRFRTKIRLMRERKVLPAVALTVGFKASAAKPFNIWEKKHNYDESNGLAGPGTGVADYLILFLFSKKVSASNFLHARLGLAPVGDPTIADSAVTMKGSSQADEIPYGLSLETRLGPRWSLRNEVAGMWGFLSSTTLDHYSVARSNVTRHFRAVHLTLNVEKGLTRESDEWVAGLYVKFDFGKKSGR